MSVKKTNLRFNLNKEADENAWEFLQTIDKSTHKSVNRFVRSLINEYADNRQAEQAETDIVEKIISAISEELKVIAPLQLFHLLGQAQQPITKEQNTAENEAQALEFLDSFNGGK